MKLTATFGGAAQIRDNLKSIQNAIAGALEEIAWYGAQPILEEAQRLVPVRSGNLQESIHIETVESTPLKATARVVPGQAAGNEWGWEPPYALRIEQGFHGDDSLGRHYEQSSEPYMWPAFVGKKDEAMAAMKQNATDVITEAMDSEINTRSAQANRR